MNNSENGRSDPVLAMPETEYQLKQRLTQTKHVSSKHLEGTSAFVVSAPLKQGFIDAFEHVTFETRCRIMMTVLYTGLQTSKEFNLFKPVPDATERIQSIQSFQMAVVEAETPANIEKRLVLNVTFDRPWEPYIRQIWQPLGVMLDVLWCNTEGFVSAYEHSFEDYARWVRKFQVDAGILYTANTLTVIDHEFLRQSERLHRDFPPKGRDRVAATLSVQHPDVVAAAIRGENPPKSDDIVTEALGALYRLTSYYPIDRPGREVKYLHRAAHMLLHGWESKRVHPKVRAAFQDWFDWYENMAYSELRAPAHDDRGYAVGNVQGGILKSYDKREPDRPISHGCLLMLQASNAKSGRGFVAAMREQITTEAPDLSGPGEGEEAVGAVAGPARSEAAERKEERPVYVNLAFTYHGLRNLEVPAKVLRAFPQEFIEGPEERAALFGDVLGNHPRRWRRPVRYQRPVGARRPAPRVEFSEIDMVVQLRVAAGEEEKICELLRGDGSLDPNHPLRDKVEQLQALAADHDVDLISVQSMRSWPERPPNASSFFTREHFGFLDGFSQPDVDGCGANGDRVRVGEVLVGHRTDRGDPPPLPNVYLDDGSFLVVRKMRQNVKALHNWAEAQSRLFKGLKTEELLARMIGRTRDGDPLVHPKTSRREPNEYNYADDPHGVHCPLHSHVRRANPRKPEDNRPPPRIMRRGMSFGERFEDRPKAERGLVFMSYQASIAEQYEVIQRWLNGGNSTGVLAMQNDPLTGLGRPGDPRTLVLPINGKLFRPSLDGAIPRGRLSSVWARLLRLVGRPGGATPTANRKGENPFVQLEWLLYLFMPSLTAIDEIAKDPSQGAAELGIGREDLLKLGRELIDKATQAERLLDTLHEFKPLSRAVYGPERDEDRYVWDKMPRFIRVIDALALIGWNKFKKAFFPKPGDFDHLANVGYAWKAFLEDFGARDPAERAYGPAIWAAIREDHDGVLRVPYPDLVRDYEECRERDREKREQKVPDRHLNFLNAPTDRVVLVASHDLVMEIYRDRRWLPRYSVAGQGERMRKSFGRIFIGMDRGREYYRESQATNQILMDEVGEGEAFDAAYRIADAVLQRALKEADAIRVDVLGDNAADRPRTTKIDLTSQYITPALADVCTYWFGIPDPEQKYVERGTWRRSAFDWKAKPRCPGDYMAPSRFMFYPDPLRAVQDYGANFGKRLHDAVYEMFEAMHWDGGMPWRSIASDGAGEPALLAARMYEEIVVRDVARLPLEKRLDLVTRNVIGAMTGMLPPTDGNLRGALHGWLKDKSLWRVQHALGSAQGSAYARARAALRMPLWEAMQKRPAPDIVWRRALWPHKLGPKGFRIRAGEKLFVGIVSATLEDRARGGHDVSPIFGGNRRGERPPVHACPGYYIAMGTMMGIIAALLDRGTIEPLSGPLMIKLTDLAAKP